MCNSINLKPGRITEPLLKIVNVLRMHPGLGVATNRLEMVTAKSTWLALLSHLAKSAKRFCALKDFVCKWYPSLEVEVLTALLLHVTRYSIFSNSSIILPGLRASIGVNACSYSSCPFLCAFDVRI